MIHSLSFGPMPTLFFILLALSTVSAVFLLYPRVSLNYIPIHIGIITLPPLVALAALFTNHGDVSFGPFRFTALSWLLAFFVLIIGLIVQRFSVRYLLGDIYYKKYFTLLTLITITDSLAWLSNDLRLMVLFWGATLLGLTLIIRLKKEWQITKKTAALSGQVFALSWIFLALAIVWMNHVTGEWQLSLVLSDHSLSQFSGFEKTCISLLFVLSVIIPAAQWPFQNWLLNSSVVPTPVSAVMHAGIVNVGGILLTYFAPFFAGETARMVLLVISGFSILMGTGIMLVQVDYKRQLVGSTIAQMGFMLIQCALGAYEAAITHAILHGLFKSTLFLQSGMALHQHKPISRLTGVSALLWKTIGIGLGVAVAFSYWLIAPGQGYQVISAIILGLSMTIAWTQLTAFDYGRIGRLIGLFILAATTVVFIIIHSALNHLLVETVQAHIPIASPLTYLLLFILLAGSALSVWLANHRHSKAYTILYLWIVRFGEPKIHLSESHPEHLIKLLSKGGPLR
jgi:NAD(P)H-quinone oxidoreductase subunit 5